jgi:DNA end-binding protein Ku
VGALAENGRMRPIGKRSISFGLVSVPVRIYAATEDHDIALHQVHAKDGGRIHYERRCEVCKKIVVYKDISRAYDDGEQRVVLTEDELGALPEASRDDIEVVEFVPAVQVDPMTLERSYYLEPERGGVKAYVLLRRTLQRTDRLAIVRFALRSKTHLGALRVHGDTLVLQSMLWADELRGADFGVLEHAPRISAKEQELADALVKSLESDFRPADYEDEYQDELRQLIDAKLEDGEAIDVAEVVEGRERPDEDGGGEVIDLMEALKRSVASRRKPGSTQRRKPAAAKRAR